MQRGPGMLAIPPGCVGQLRACARLRDCRRWHCTAARGTSSWSLDHPSEIALRSLRYLPTMQLGYLSRAVLQPCCWRWPDLATVSVTATRPTPYRCTMRAATLAAYSSTSASVHPQAGHVLSSSSHALLGAGAAVVVAVTVAVAAVLTWVAVVVAAARKKDNSPTSGSTLSAPLASLTAAGCGGEGRGNAAPRAACCLLPT